MKKVIFLISLILIFVYFNIFKTKIQKVLLVKEVQSVDASVSSVVKKQKVSSKILRSELQLNNECDQCFIDKLELFDGEVDHRFQTGDTLLSMAIGDGRTKLVKSLLKKGANPSIEFNNYGHSMLMDSAFQGHDELVELLISYNVDINLTDKEGKSALIYAAKEGFDSIVSILLKNGADQSIADLKGLTALDYANKYKLTKVILLLKE